MVTLVPVLLILWLCRNSELGIPGCRLQDKAPGRARNPLPYCSSTPLTLGLLLRHRDQSPVQVVSRNYYGLRQLAHLYSAGCGRVLSFRSCLFFMGCQNDQVTRWRTNLQILSSWIWNLLERSKMADLVASVNVTVEIPLSSWMSEHPRTALSSSCSKMAQADNVTSRF